MDTETLLARYIDGEMADEEMSAFEQRVANEPQLAARLDAWAQQDAAVAHDLAALLDAAPWDTSNLKASTQPIDLAAHRQAKSAAGRVSLPGKRWFVPASVAASLALAALLSISLMQGGGDPALDALDHLPSGQSLALDDGTGITAVLTFAAADGRWCREFARAQGGSGIACRTGGSWQVEGEVGDNGHRPVDPSQGYATVGADDSAVLDDLYASLAASEPLGPTEEARLLRNGWTTPVD